MHKYNKGAVSIFVVIFTALLVTVVTVSFMRLMIRDQQQATDSDLSQSAYDAALAGVEDAKRALTRYDASTDGDLGRCNQIAVVLGRPNTDPVGVGSSQLQQSYTCVQVQLDTPDYRKALKADETQLIPLRATGEFNQVKIEWFDQDDSETVTLQEGSSSGSSISLDPRASWPSTRPPVLETQLMQTNRTFSLSEFDNTSGDKSNANTLFLYPKARSTATTYSFTEDIRRDKDSDAPVEAQCKTDIHTGTPYACVTTLNIPDPRGSGTTQRNDDTAYLRLTARYNKANVKITLLRTNNTGTTTTVDFDGVQPLVDSTGKANDLFRRVRARIEPAGGVYPEAAVDMTSSFCKTFRVTDRTTDYSVGECIP